MLETRADLTRRTSVTRTNLLEGHQAQEQELTMTVLLEQMLPMLRSVLIGGGGGGGLKVTSVCLTCMYSSPAYD